MPDQFVDEVGNQEHLVAHYDLTAERVVKAVRTALDTTTHSGRTDRKERIS
jgi:transketolase